MALTKVTEGVRTLGTGEVATANMATDPTNASNLSSGDVPLAQLGNAPETDLSPVLNDIATLALHSAVQNNQAAYNLANAFVDQYEDDTGIDTETDVDRSASGEYMASVSGTAADSETSLLLHFEGDNDGVVFTDSSTYGKTATLVTTPVTSTDQAKFGSTSGKFDSNGESITFANDSTFQMAGEDCAFDFWWWSTYSGGADNSPFNYRSNSNGIYFRRDGASGMDIFWNGVNLFGGGTFTTSTWTHWAITKDGGSIYLFKDGTEVSSAATGQPSMVDGGTTFKVGSFGPATNYIDEFRVSKGDSRWTANFTPPTSPYDSQTVNATGNYTSTTETSAATVSSMGIVVLYKNESGTATLDTDLIAQVSANGGTNYTSAPLIAAGTFSTGINIAVANGVSISNTGTAPKYKISFANQVLGSKQTHVYGVALLY